MRDGLIYRKKHYFFQKLRNIVRYYQHFSKLKAKEFRKRELDLRAKLEVTIATLHEDTYDPIKQGEVSKLSMTMDEIENRKARDATIRAGIKWQVFGDKCSAKFFKSVRQKNNHTVITELKDIYGSIFTRREDLDRICYDFYQKLYVHKEISEETIKEVFIGFPVTFINEMNVSITRAITEEELGAAVRDMTKGKTPGYDGIPVEFFQQL